MKTTKTISAITFAAALCCVSPAFAGNRTGGAGGMGGAGNQFRSRQQFHPHAQRQQREMEHNGQVVRQERERRTTSNGTKERERLTKEPNGTVVQQREQERVSPSGQTETRTQHRKIPPQ